METQIGYIKALLRALWTTGIATKGKPSPYAATRVDIWEAKLTALFWKLKDLTANLVEK